MRPTRGKLGNRSTLAGLACDCRDHQGIMFAGLARVGLLFGY